MTRIKKSVLVSGIAATMLAAAGTAHGQSFLAVNNYTTPSFPVHLTIADFTGDGRKDVAVACNGAGQFAIFAQTAGGLLTLGGARTIAGGGQPVHVNAMDIDFAGPIDLVVADGTGPLQAFHSNGSSNPVLWGENADLNVGYTLGTGGSFSTGFSINPVANAVVVAGMGAGGGLQARIGDGDGTYEGFQQGPMIQLGAGAVNAARGRLDAGPLADDLAVCVSSSNIVKIMLYKDFVMCSDICWRGYAYDFQCPLGPGEVVPSNVVVGMNPVGVVLDHFDSGSNANTDMAVICDGDDTVRIFRGNGNGTFTATQTINLGADVKAIASGDLTLDNRADLAVAIDPPGTGNGSVVVLVNNGAGVFSVGPTLTIADNVRAIQIGDLSNDGKPDIAVVTRSNNNLAVFRNSTAPACIANFDLSGGVGVPDIFAFLSAWFGGYPAADVNQNGAFDVPDIFLFLSRWFAGC